jgi:hypothetical protein
MKKKYRNIKLVVYKKKRAKEKPKQYKKNYLRSNFVELYKAQLLAFNKTRDMQWKFNISIWGLLLTVAYLKHLVSDIFSQSLVGILFLIALFGHYIFVYIVQRSLAASQRIMNTYLEQMNRYNKTEDVVINNRKYERMYVLTLTDYLWIAFQVIITFFILLIFLQV